MLLLELFISLLVIEVSGESLWTSTSGSKCKTSCIDQGLFFCSNDERATKGACCSSPADCAPSTSSLCSFDSNASGLAYYTCPREVDVCGSKEVIIVDKNLGNTLELFSDWNGGSMVNGSVCRYRLIFPFEAKDYDEIKVQIGSITNAIAYLIETPEFKSKEAN